MGVTLKRQRDGETWRPYWYGEYTESNGKRKVVNLGVRWTGIPPESLRLPGNADFESSREKAEEKLARYTEEAGRKGRAEHLTERLIESKTGRAVQYVRITQLPERWRNLGREAEATEAHLVNCDAHFRRFAVFMETRNPSSGFLYEVTPEDAAAFVEHLRKLLAASTAQYGVRLLSKSFSRFLPTGAENPFAAFVGRRGKSKSATIHRKPFTPHELKALLDVARAYDKANGSGELHMYPLIVTAACSGMRRADVCGLRWKNVSFAEGMLTVKTSKTGETAEIPLFRPLRAVLKNRKRDRSGLVFPEAARLLRESPKALTWRFKKIVAEALDDTQDVTSTPPLRVPPAKVETEGSAAIAENFPKGARRERIERNFRRYCAGESVRQIEKKTRVPRVTVSADLHAVQDLIGKPFMPSTPKASMTAAVARLTRVNRKQGQKAASIRDWHALRTTWISLALSAGVPVELVRRVTGHATVEVVLQHYFRPDREQFRAALTDAMPGILTGGKRKRLKPAEELQALAAKFAAGNATDKDKARLRTLAARV